MTYGNIIEEVKQVFPEIGISQLKLEMTGIIKDFLMKTRIYRLKSDITPAGNTITYSLPDNLIALQSVRYFDSSGHEFRQPYSPKYEIEGHQITFLDSMGNGITALPREIKKITISFTSYISRDEIQNLSLSPPIPEEFHAAIVSGIMASLYRKFPMLVIQDKNGNTQKALDLNAMHAWKNEYKEHILSARKLANINKDETMYEL